MVKSFPSCAGLPSIDMPPNQPHRSIEKMTFWVSRIHMPLYLPAVSFVVFRHMHNSSLVVWKARSKPSQLTHGFNLLLNHSFCSLNDWLNWSSSEGIWVKELYISRTMCCRCRMSSWQSWLSRSFLPLQSVEDCPNLLPNCCILVNFGLKVLEDPWADHIWAGCGSYCADV